MCAIHNVKTTFWHLYDYIQLLIINHTKICPFSAMVDIQLGCSSSSYFWQCIVKDTKSGMHFPNNDITHIAWCIVWEMCFPKICHLNHVNYNINRLQWCFKLSRVTTSSRVNSHNLIYFLHKLYWFTCTQFFFKVPY